MTGESMADRMTFREMNLRVFEGRPVPGVLFQPRFEPWFEYRQRLGDLPESLQHGTVFDAYDTLDVSMRYIHYATGCPSPVEVVHDPPLRVTERTDGDGTRVTVHETPHGDLVTRYGFASDGSCRVVEFPVRTAEDLRRLEWVYRHTRYVYNPEGFAHGAARMGDRGEPQFYVCRSPYQCLSLEWMAYEEFIMALMCEPEHVGPVLEAMDAAHDPLYEGLAADPGPRIINFGENIDARLMSPDLFERHHLPFYEKRDACLKAAGKFTHAHFDGSFHSLLPFFARLPFDGIEALTPVPQGDATLEEIREHLGDKVLLDGIPAVFFLPEFPMERLQECVERLVALFAPRLVLGISDELPMGAGPEAVERLLWVRDYCWKCAPRPGPESV